MKRYLQALRSVVAITALATAPLLTGGCNSLQSETVAQHSVGPAGPTYPSGYYFDVTVTPHAVQVPSSVTYLVRVWDSNGNVVSGVTVMGAGTEKPFVLITDYAGIAVAGVEIKAAGGSGAQTFYVTFNVEDTTLTIPLILIPNT